MTPFSTVGIRIQPEQGYRKQNIQGNLIRTRLEPATRSWM
jgi:hypothetical protein